MLYGMVLCTYSRELSSTLLQCGYARPPTIVYTNKIPQEHHRFENNWEIEEIPNPPPLFLFKLGQLRYFFTTSKLKFIFCQFFLLIFYQSPINLLSIYFQPSINLLSIFYQSSIKILSNFCQTSLSNFCHAAAAAAVRGAETTSYNEEGSIMSQSNHNNVWVRANNTNFGSGNNRTELLEPGVLLPQEEAI